MPLIGKIPLLAAANQLANLATDSGLDSRVRRAGILLEGRVKARASGRPGPRVRTGNYRRSWNTRKVAGEPATYSVGTNQPQGRRLELGFTGTDSAGRTYNQPPFPHLEPAYLESENEIVDIIVTRVDEIWLGKALP